MADKVRWGVLSTARIGEKRVIPALQAAHNCEVVAVASRSLEKAQEFAERAGIPQAYGSYEELIAADGIERSTFRCRTANTRWSILRRSGFLRCAKSRWRATPKPEIVDAFASRNVLLPRRSCTASTRSTRN